MKKIVLMVVLLCAAQLSATAQNRVQILDETTNEAIASANIYYPDSRTGTATDEQGWFTINSTLPSVNVQISVLGYTTYFGALPTDTRVIYLTPEAEVIREVVVSGSSSKLQGENVQNVERLSFNLPMEGTMSLADILKSVAGVDSYSTGVGIGKPVIRGMSGSRIAVFSQGIRVENQQWGDEHGLGLNENGYEQVEIIKGPSSLLYGSDALGGVLYFVDERYARENSFEGRLSSEYNSNTQGFRESIAYKVSQNRLHFNLFGDYTTNMDYRDGNGNRVVNSRFRTGDAKATLGYVGDRFTTALKYNFLNEQYGLSEEDSDYLDGRRPQMPYQNLTTHILSSENNIYFMNNSKLKVDLGYVLNNRQEWEEEADEPALGMNLSTLSYNARWYAPRLGRWSFVLGSQGFYQTNRNYGEEELIPNAETADVGLFATLDYYYTAKSYWQAGIRYDYRNINGDLNYNAFNFSTGIYQQLAKDLSLRLNLSSGYRAPSMFELFSDGVHEGTNRYEIGSASLTTENAYQIDASLVYRTDHLELFATPYFNYIRDYIYLNPSSDIIDEMPVYYYEQTDAMLYGGEAGFHLHPHPWDWLHIEGSYATTFAQNRANNPLPLIPAQKINLLVRVIFGSFSFYVQDQYAFAQTRVAEYETPTAGYNLVNMGANYEFKIYRQPIQISVAVNNLFDVAYFDHLSRYRNEGIYNIGRNVSIKLSLPLSALRLI